MTETSTILSDQQTTALLTQALAHLDKNEIWQAEAALKVVLDARPQEPDGLQLIGLVRRMQGRDAEAEDFYRRSLAAKPDQPNVHHNLGNLLTSLGRYDEAIDSLREAVRLKPNYVDAHLNLGKALSGAGQFVAAEKSYRRALWLRPGYPFAMQSLGAVLNDLGKPKDAEAVLRTALAAESQNPRQFAALEHNLGVSLNLQDRFAEAVPLFESAKAKVPEMPLVDYNRGNALQRLNRFDEAVDSYRAAVAREPLNLNAHRDLNHLLYRLGRDDELLTSYDDAAMLYPEVGELPLAKAVFQFQRNDYAAARENFERAVRMLPASVTPRIGLGLVLARINEFDAAIHEHEIALKMEPKYAHAWRNYAETLMRAREPKKALAAAEEALAIEPMHQGALAMLGTALDMLGDPRAGFFNDYEKFVQPFELAPPQGYGDMEIFNRDLNAFLDRMHRDKREDLEQTLRGGTQSFDNLFGKGHKLVELLRARIDEAVGVYISRLQQDDTHPLLKRRREKFEYAASWSGRLYDCGYHTNHIHSKGWISSAYYVDLPESVADSDGKQGWIKFGEPNFDAGLANPIRRIVQPQVGTLVLFPSYMWHGTVPFRSQRSRTTIAFDVVPR
jgi:tetratricopeptide (TPR) repeat protein